MLFLKIKNRITETKNVGNTGLRYPLDVLLYLCVVYAEFAPKKYLNCLSKRRTGY
jgi:hypothetical protein